MQRRLHLPIICLILVAIAVGASPASSRPEDQLLNDLLRAADQLNREVLRMTALTDDQENRIGNQMATGLQRHLRFRQPFRFDINGVFQKLRRHVRRSRLAYAIRVVDADEVNAFAIAGGKTYVHAGLIEYLQSEDELALVLGHEIAHNELKHCVHKVQLAVRSAQIDPRLADWVQLGYTISRMAFNKQEEFEADALGLKIALKAGYSKQRALMLLQRLARDEKRVNSGDPDIDRLIEFIDTHPPAQERLARLKG